MEDFDAAAIMKRLLEARNDPMRLLILEEMQRQPDVPDPPPETPDVACVTLAFLQRSERFFLFARYMSYAPAGFGHALAFTQCDGRFFRTTLEWNEVRICRFLEEEMSSQEFKGLITACEQQDFFHQPECLAGGVTMHLTDDWFGMKMTESGAKWIRVPGSGSGQPIEIELKKLINQYAPSFFAYLMYGPDDDEGDSELGGTENQ